MKKRKIPDGINSFAVDINETTQLSLRKEDD